ncbi:Ribose 5-phosphate isomerase B [Bacillus badius]|nr:Ribose 5-phosphate isomerase B [Bacillus badius]
MAIWLPELCPSLIAMEDAKTPAGSAGQERPRRRFGAEEARRPPRGKRSVWNGNQ